MEIKFERDEKRDTKDTAAYRSSPIKFCFVGPRGVGKTSLLASMYEQIKKNCISSVLVDIHSPLGEKTKPLLDKAHEQMLEMLEETETGAIVSLETGIRGSTDAKVFEFIGKNTVKDTDFVSLTKFKEFYYTFHLTDMPGTWYATDATNVHKDEVREVLKESLVSFLAVDASALMKGGATNMRVNKCSHIDEWYRAAATQLGAAKHTVVIVLSRCEKYWNEKTMMVEKLREVYGGMIAALKQAGVRVYVTWVKTVGGLEFSHFDTERLEDGSKRSVPRFTRTGDYEPENCATPLQLALHHGLQRAVEAIPVDVWAKLGFNIKELAVKAAANLADELNKGLDAGGEGTYAEI